MRTLIDWYKGLPPAKQTHELYWTCVNTQKIVDAHPRDPGFQSIGGFLGDSFDGIDARVSHVSLPDTRKLALGPNGLDMPWHSYEASKAGILRDAAERGTGLTPSEYEQAIRACTERQQI